MAKAVPVHKIHPQLTKLAVPIDSLVLDPKNARKHGSRNLDSIRASLDRFGQRKPVVVQAGTRVVRAGNGTVQALRDLGWTHVAAVVVEEADVEATAYALTDNRSAELAEWDWVVLEDSLAALAAEMPQVDLEALGWAAAEIDALALTKLWQDNDPPVAGGGGRADLAGQPIKFSPEERAMVDAAIKKLRANGHKADDDGAAVALICKMYLEATSAAAAS